MASTKKINLTDIHLNTENYRFEPIASQKEAIDTLIEDQGDKLINLATHIIEHGFNPNDRVQVATSNHDATKYNVLEGNRRVVAIKLLSNPDILDGGKHANLKKKFKALHDAKKSLIPKQIECTVYDNPAEADKWIKLKHAGQVDGMGTVAWNAQQIQRFEEKVEGKSSIALQSLKLLNNSPSVPATLKADLPKIKITNLDRLISDPDVRDMLGIEIHNGVIQSEIEEEEVVKGLTQIARDLLDPKFNVKKIYLKEDRKDYLSKFDKSSKPKLTKKAVKPWQVNSSASSGGASPAKKPKANPKDRDTLIPRSCILKISNAKVNAMYHELQKLSLSKYTNAAAVSFRVFVELSLDCYIEEHKLKFTGRVFLKDKVNSVTTHLESKALADKNICKGIRNEITNKNDLLGIETWHAYVHNAKYQAKPTDLVTTWDNVVHVIEKIWENIK